MRIMGIDPGIGRTGWGIIDEEHSKIKPVAFGCLETPPKEEIASRLASLYSSLQTILRDQKPDIVAIEELFFNTNAKTALIVGQARGVMLLLSAQEKIPVAVYTPLQVKVALTGYGRADKAQIGHMVKIILSLPVIPKPDDTADALAIALTHAFSRKMRI